MKDLLSKFQIYIILLLIGCVSDDKIVECKSDLCVVVHSNDEYFRFSTDTVIYPEFESVYLDTSNRRSINIRFDKGNYQFIQAKSINNYEFCNDFELSFPNGYYRIYLTPIVKQDYIKYSTILFRRPNINNKDGIYILELKVSMHSESGSIYVDFREELNHFNLYEVIDWGANISNLVKLHIN